MKTWKSIFYLIPFLFSFCSIGQDDFITFWDMSLSDGTSPEKISFFVDVNLGGTTYTWQNLNGPENDSGIIPAGQNEIIIAGIPVNSQFKLTIQHNNLNRFYIDSGPDRLRLTHVGNWGLVQWTSMEDAFYGCSNLEVIATDIPNLASVNSMMYMFRGCLSLTGPGNINMWDVSNVTNFLGMFTNATSFNQPLNFWDTGNAIYMSAMFKDAQSFNQPIGNWDVSNVTQINDIFEGASSFNQPLNNWDTDNFILMNSMFANATSFNQPLNNWNTVNAQFMFSMFENATSFNQDVNSWDVSNVVNMETMFENATSFNQPLNNWNVGNVLNMKEMFHDAISFNQNIGSWIFNPDVNFFWLLDDSGMDCDNYSQTLIGWQQNNPGLMNKAFFSGGMKYNILGAQARQTLIDDQNWSFLDDGPGHCGEFVTEWDLSHNGSSPSEINFRTTIENTGALYYWETFPIVTDSGFDTLSAGFNLQQTISNLPAGATIRLIIAPENLKHFAINNGADRKRLTKVYRWGNAHWNNMNSAFYGCENLEIPATDIPDLSSVLFMSAMFRGCTQLTGPSNINDWDVSNVISMWNLFREAKNFNQPLNNWNTGNVTNMVGLFYDAESFNQPIGAWNTANVINMSGMFQLATAFNQPIGTWNTSNVTTMEKMFEEAENFNQPLAGWNTSNVQNMRFMFFKAYAFNQNIGSWNTSEVTNMQGMFSSASSFNQDINSWNTANVTDMSSMFSSASAFNSPLNQWNTSSLTNMSHLFYNATNFNQPLNNWNTENVTNMDYVFWNAISFNSSIEQWNTSNVTSMYGMFIDAESFDQPIGQWNTSSVTDMRLMFNGASSFNQPLNNWNTGNVLNMGGMFGEAVAFNSPIGNWNTESVINLSTMFYNATSFNQDISDWDVSSVEWFIFTFWGATSFNRDLSDWDVSNASSLNSMFRFASSFNQSLGNWQFDPSADIDGIIFECGMDCNSYSQTLSGWQQNNPNLMGADVGTLGKNYGEALIASRNHLINSQNWLIYGDNLISSDPYLVPAGNTVSSPGVDYCNAIFSNEGNPSEKIVNMDLNGNALDLNATIVKVRNEFIDNIPNDVTTHTSSNSGYYQMSDGLNTFRLSRRMVTVLAPGNFNINGGVLLRIYYHPEDLQGIFQDVMPVGNLGNFGWCKIPNDDAQGIISNMNASAPNIAGAIDITPVYGIEDGVHYAEFLVTSFSTFAIYAQTQNVPLPISLNSFQAECTHDGIFVSWSTASELNADYYILESSRDGLTWHEETRVLAAGNSNQLTNYEYLAQNYGSLSYYRLIQFDTDGKNEVFGPISSNCNLNQDSWSVFPNPATHQCFVEIKSIKTRDHLVVELLDMTGRVVLRKLVKAEQGTIQMQLDLSEFQSGQYIVRMQNEEGVFPSMKLIKE